MEKESKLRAGLLATGGVVGAIAASSCCVLPLAFVSVVTLAIENMTCAACPITVRAAIKGVGGLKEVTVDFAKKVAVVMFDDALTSPDQLAVASRNAGFPATRKE